MCFNSKALDVLPWIYSPHWDSMIRGHHIYEDIWTSFMGEILQEADNAEYRFSDHTSSAQT